MLKFASRGDSNVVYKCTVRLLEDTEILECEYRPHHKGKYLLEYVCQQLNLVEYDYLGLRYVDITDQRHWLDLGKSICKQVKDLDPVLFSFRVKYYPPDPFRLKEEITRYQIYLQLKRDLLHGRLYCVPNEAAMLAALIVQAELGDHDAEIHIGNYVSELRLLLKQTEAIEDKAMDIHQKQLRGQSQAQVENTFLRLASQLDTYGVDPHPVKDHKSAQLYLGINYSGILTIQGSRKTHHFRWPDVQKINYEGKMFIVHLNYNDKKHTVGFKCPTGAACRHIWRCAIEQMLFFTLPTSSDAPSIVTGGGFFSWGTKFKYTGRTEREILEDAANAAAAGRDENGQVNSGSGQGSARMRRKASSVPATPSTPLQPHLGYSSLPRSSHSDAGGSRLDPTGSFLLSSGAGTFDSGMYGDVAALETVCEDQEGGMMGGGKLRTTVLKEDSMDRFSDYYFRDSFEHSSSESQLNLTTASTATSRYEALAPPPPQSSSGGGGSNMLSAPPPPPPPPLHHHHQHSTQLASSITSQPVPPPPLPTQQQRSSRSATPLLSQAAQHDSFTGRNNSNNLTVVGNNNHHGQPASSATTTYDALGSKESHIGAAPSHSTAAAAASVAAMRRANGARRFSMLRALVPSVVAVTVCVVVGTVVLFECDGSDWLPAWWQHWPEAEALRRDWYEPLREYLRDRWRALFRSA